MIRLNIGCGPVQPDGWINLDPDPQWAAQEAPIHAALDGADGAVAHHVLQMVPWPDLVPTLDLWRRALRPGAWLRLSVPDLELVGDWLDPAPHAQFPDDLIADEHESSLHGKVCMWLSQAGATRSVFTGPYLIELCLRAGFQRAEESLAVVKTNGPSWLTKLDRTPDRRRESVFVEARA